MILKARTGKTKNSEYTIDTSNPKDLTMTGSRGAHYILEPIPNKPGCYTPVSLFSGPMVRQGNQMAITIIGDIAEFVYLHQLKKTR